MLRTVGKILALLTRQEQRQLVWLLLAMVVSALIEVAGIASIMPFMAVVGNPEVVEHNRYFRLVYHALEFTSIEGFLIFLGAVVLAVIVLSNLIKALTTWFELRFINFRTASLSQRLFLSYLSRPYEYFLNQNTSLLGKNILQEVFQFILNVLKPATEIFSKLVVTAFICGLLVLVDPVLAMIIVLLLGGAYTLLYLFVQKILGRLGKDRFEANAQRFKTASEALGGIKELKLLGRERKFFERFSHYAQAMAGNIVTHQVISQLPRFIMEVLSFGGILIIVLYYLTREAGVGNVLPILALYAFAGYRLMPALQGIFSSLTTVRFNIAALDALHQDFTELVPGTPAALADYGMAEPLPIHQRIDLAGISFTYPGAREPVLRSLNLQIPKNSSIGLVGATGAGKTTIVDILLGLLLPQEGELLVDGQPVKGADLVRWQRNLGYVPQAIFLADDTMAANIAFGRPPEEIDMAAVVQAAKTANLHQFVMEELPDGYATVIGERGVRLSGGQRQRIGIARALYDDPEILLMDEATSSLDGITESAVMQAIRHLAGKKTTITVAHRLSTLKDCDVIYVMEKAHFRVPT